MALEKEEEEEGKEVLYDREDGGKGEGGSASKDAEERGGDAESCKTWMGGKGEGDRIEEEDSFISPFFRQWIVQWGVWETASEGCLRFFFCRE